MLNPANLEEAYAPLDTPSPYMKGPQCQAPACFIGSYPPVTPAGQRGPFFVNTYYLQGDRKSELAGPVPVRAANCRR